MRRCREVRSWTVDTVTAGSNVWLTGYRSAATTFPGVPSTSPTARSVRSGASEMGAFSGRGRIWGTANPRYWASLDPQRPKKSVGLILDVGRFVRPFITPDDPNAVEALIREHANLATPIEDSGSGPVI